MNHPTSPFVVFAPGKSHPATHHLPITLESIFAPDPARAAFEKVRANKGCAGIDAVTISELKDIFPARWEPVRTALLAESWKPQPLRRVEIPKPGPEGGIRKLGIPSVMDRVVHQAIAQALAPHFEPRFSPHSFAYRPGRSAHDAVAAVQDALSSDGYGSALHLDIRNFFDSVPHRMVRRLMERETALDRRLPNLIDRILTGGVFEGGAVRPTPTGIPQGSPLSPLLANLVLNEFDTWLETGGRRFARYADDVVILLRSAAEGSHFIDAAEEFLGSALGLEINREKTTLTAWPDLKFLGFGFLPGPDGLARRRISEASLTECRAEIDQLTDPGTAGWFEETAAATGEFLSGWAAYYQFTEDSGQVDAIYAHARDRMRRFQWSAWRDSGTRIRELTRRGVDPNAAARAATIAESENAHAGNPEIAGVLHRALADESFSRFDLTPDRITPSPAARSGDRVSYSGHVGAGGSRTRRRNEADGILWPTTAGVWLRRALRSRFFRFRFDIRRRRGRILPRLHGINSSSAPTISGSDYEWEFR